MIFTMTEDRISECALSSNYSFNELTDLFTEAHNRYSVVMVKIDNGTLRWKIVSKDILDEPAVMAYLKTEQAWE